MKRLRKSPFPLPQFNLIGTSNACEHASTAPEPHLLRQAAAGGPLRREGLPGEVLQRAVPPMALDVVLLAEAPELDRRRAEELVGVGHAEPLRGTRRERAVVLARPSSLDRSVDVWDQSFHCCLLCLIRRNGGRRGKLLI
ncbi:hypothetical protein Cni_G25597 [Canna indica]|uniref:Uncharacterized protein n=1 Tax=Canna indica TaxID=4628 RepID=A0AAQ3KY01_9LILI|nr:hypothetical protein Cni_G25597 [Canna indica]